MENRKLNDKYRQIAEKLIQSEPDLNYIKNSNVRIAYLESDSAKKNGDKVVHGECERVQSKNKWAIDYDFTITLFSENNRGMTDEQIKILIMHELYHVGIDRADDGKESYSIIKHDLEDFKAIIDRYGTDWAKVENVVQA